jgi:hypothetical protein
LHATEKKARISVNDGPVMASGGSPIVVVVQ